jgi:hypothetical protein
MIPAVCTLCLLCCLLPAATFTLFLFNLEGYFLPSSPHFLLHHPLHRYSTPTRVLYVIHATTQTNHQEKNGRTSSDGQVTHFLFFSLSFYTRNTKERNYMRQDSRTTDSDYLSIIASIASTHHQKQRQATTSTCDSCCYKTVLFYHLSYSNSSNSWTAGVPSSSNRVQPLLPAAHSSA